MNPDLYGIYELFVLIGHGHLFENKFDDSFTAISLYGEGGWQREPVHAFPPPPALAQKAGEPVFLDSFA